MRLVRIFAITSMAAGLVFAQDLTGDAWRMEVKGDAAEAREQLQKAAASAPNRAAQASHDARWSATRGSTVSRLMR